MKKIEDKQLEEVFWGIKKILPYAKKLKVITDIATDMKLAAINHTK